MYVELSDLEAVIPAEFLTQALDDNSDGVIDAWESVQKAACRAVDAKLGVRFTVPFPEPYPAIVSEAAFLFAAEACFNRRGIYSDENPFARQAGDMRRELASIGDGDRALDPTIQRQKPSVSIVTSPAKTHSDRISL